MKWSSWRIRKHIYQSYIVEYYWGLLWNTVLIWNENGYPYVSAEKLAFFWSMLLFGWSCFLFLGWQFLSWLGVKFYFFLLQCYPCDCWFSGSLCSCFVCLYYRVCLCVRMEVRGQLEGVGSPNCSLIRNSINPALWLFTLCKDLREPNSCLRIFLYVIPSSVEVFRNSDFSKPLSLCLQ